MKNGGRVINAMIQIETGRDLVDKAVLSKDNIHITISSEKTNDLSLGSTTFKKGDPIAGGNLETGEVYLNLEITIYEGSINEISKDPMSSEQGVEYVRNNLNQDQKIGRTGVHEFEHATNPVDRNLIKDNEDITSEQHKVAQNKASRAAEEYGALNKK